MFVFGDRSLFPILYSTKIFDLQLKVVVESGIYSKEDLYAFTLNVCSFYYFDDDFPENIVGPTFLDFKSLRITSDTDVYCLYKFNREQKKVYLPYIGLEGEFRNLNYNNLLYYPNRCLYEDP